MSDSGDLWRAAHDTAYRELYEHDKMMKAHREAGARTAELFEKKKRAREGKAISAAASKGTTPRAENKQNGLILWSLVIFAGWFFLYGNWSATSDWLNANGWVMLPVALVGGLVIYRLRWVLLKVSIGIVLLLLGIGLLSRLA